MTEEIKGLVRIGVADKNLKGSFLLDLRQMEEGEKAAEILELVRAIEQEDFCTGMEEIEPAEPGLYPFYRVGFSPEENKNNLRTIFAGGAEGRVPREVSMLLHKVKKAAGISLIPVPD